MLSKSRRGWTLLSCLVALLVTVAGCGLPGTLRGSAAGPPATGPSATATPTDIPVEPDVPKPHPAYARHFTDPLYHDEGDELAPFGSDEGSDTLYGWVGRRGKVTRCSTLRQMLAADGMSLEETVADARRDPVVNGFILGEGYTLLLFTGHIDPEGRSVLVSLLRREDKLSRGRTPREVSVMLRDLESYPATGCPTSAA